MRVEEAWQMIDAALIRMRRLLQSPQPEVSDGVDLSAVLVVDTIARQENENGHTRIVDIANALSVAPSTASRLVASTEAAGYIERMPGLDDPRSVTLSLTDAGTDLNLTATKYRLKLLQDAVPNWDAETTTMFARLLDEFSLATRNPARR